MDTGQQVLAPPSPCRALGVDLGINCFATLSNGEKISNNRFLTKSLKKLKRKTKEASRKKKGSRKEPVETAKMVASEKQESILG